MTQVSGRKDGDAGGHEPLRRGMPQLASSAPISAMVLPPSTSAALPPSTRHHALAGVAHARHIGEVKLAVGLGVELSTILPKNGAHLNARKSRS